MDFPLDALAPAVTARAGSWRRLDLVWLVKPVAPNHGKSVVVGEFESAAWLGALQIWATGETELDVVRLADDRAVSKHYDLTGTADLDVLLDELEALLFAGRMPGDDAAYGA